MLFSPESHEAPVDEPWSAAAVRAAIEAIVADAESTFDDGWPVHPGDDGADALPGDRIALYCGSAGGIDAIHRLARRGLAELRPEYAAHLERVLAAEPEFPDDDRRSVYFGEPGIRLVLQRLAPSAANLHRLAELIDANAQDDHRELMWGSPGTILAGRELGLDVTASVEWLRAQREADGLWTQTILGKPNRLLGPAHGFAGCVLALGDPDDVTATLAPLAVEEDGLVNWPAVAGERLDEHGNGRIRTQWCHGAPGMVATLAPLLDEALAVAGGELTWRAGPLRKGPGLCHGTAGNGYAFLALLERTGDESWLARARAFAMHAVRQVERSRAQHGRGRPTLWSGDLGTALYLADCIEGRGELPLTMPR